MDYTGWELERQRRALAALLLGGGTAEDEEAVREREGRSPEAGLAVSTAAGEQTAAVDGRSGGDGFGDTAREAWDAVREIEWRRLGGFFWPKVPDSAWTGALDTGEARGGGETETAVQGESRGMVQGEEAVFPNRTAGRLAEAASDGKTVSRVNRKPWRKLPPESLSEVFGKEAGGGEADGKPFSMAAYGGWEAAETLSWGGGSGSRERSGGTVFQVLEETAGTGFRGGGPGSAALRTEESARALSLAVQRDARRYDGGFAIY